jgi:hypothetical protein
MVSVSTYTISCNKCVLIIMLWVMFLGWWLIQDSWMFTDLEHVLVIKVLSCGSGVTGYVDGRFVITIQKNKQKCYMRCVHFWTCILHVYPGLSHFKAINLSSPRLALPFVALQLVSPTWTTLTHIRDSNTVLVASFLPLDADPSSLVLIKSVGVCQFCYLNVILALTTAALPVSSFSLTTTLASVTFQNNYVTQYQDLAALFQQFLVAFAELSKTTFSTVMSVRPHGISILPLDGFSWNLVFEYFSKICQVNSSLIKIWQQ